MTEAEHKQAERVRTWTAAFCDGCEQPLGIERELTPCSHLPGTHEVEVVELAPVVDALQRIHDRAQKNIHSAGFIADHEIAPLLESLSRTSE